MTLLIAAIGGLVSTYESPATTGVVLFQVFFSLAYFVVTLVGPARRRQQHRLRARGTHLGGRDPHRALRPAVVARGKFLAAYTAIGMYIVMLAPVGALPFLFGGVTATETSWRLPVPVPDRAASASRSASRSARRWRACARPSWSRCCSRSSRRSSVYFGARRRACSYAAHDAWPGVPDGPPDLAADRPTSARRSTCNTSSS